MLGLTGKVIPWLFDGTAKEMEPALFGLIGVVIGAFLTIAKESFFRYQQTKKDAALLSIKVSCELLRFSGKCAEVVGDHGEPDAHGCFSPRTSVPDFKPESMSVEWKSLPDKLMLDVLDLPFKIEQAKDEISNVAEYVAGPPDYSEWYEERQLRYAILGLAALDLAVRLRDHAGLQLNEKKDYYPKRYLEEKKALIEQARSKLIATDC